MKSKRKGQAAFEFLATYGWAVMAAIVVIGALVSFGFTDLRDQIPDSCLLGTDFICDGAIADVDGRVLIEFSPMKKFHIDNLICTYPDGTTVKQDYSAVPILPNQKYIIGCEETTQNVPAHKDKMGIKIVYHLNETGALPRVSDGEIVAKISENPLDLSLISPGLEKD